ncbi:RWD domain-containing protein [Cladochytrium replicatum]|nr:RWD domain-containing protein [Cladochytrium replicatum]
MDYEDEQNQEIEALKSIYFDEFEEIETGPPAKFAISIALDDDVSTDGYNADPGASLSLVVSYSATYPETIPALSFSRTTGLSEEDREILLEQLTQEAEINVGMGMVFTLVSTVKELVEKLVRDRRDKAEREDEERKRLEEEAELARYQGTRVNVDTFKEWKTKFLAEIEEAKTKEMRMAAEAKKGKLTGRQLFEKDKTLVNSDMAFASDGVEVEVDLALFDELEGLDEDDEEENDVLANFTEDD